MSYHAHETAIVDEGAQINNAHERRVRGIGVYAIAHQGRGGRRQAVQCNRQLVPRQRLGIKKNSDTWAAVLLDEATTVRIIHGLKQALSC